MCFNDADALRRTPAFVKNLFEERGLSLRIGMSNGLCCSTLVHADSSNHTINVVSLSHSVSKFLDDNKTTAFSATVSVRRSIESFALACGAEEVCS